MADVKVALDELKEDSDSGKLGAIPATDRKRRMRLRPLPRQRPRADARPQPRHGRGPVHYECADRVIAQFVERATAKGLDTSCLLRLTTRPFILPK